MNVSDCCFASWNSFNINSTQVWFQQFEILHCLRSFLIQPLAVNDFSKGTLPILTNYISVHEHYFKSYQNSVFTTNYRYKNKIVTFQSHSQGFHQSIQYSLPLSLSVLANLYNMRIWWENKYYWYIIMLWFKFILGFMFFELVSVLFAIVPD